MYLGKMFIAWMKVMIMLMVSIHMKKNDDGKIMTNNIVEGSL